MAKPDTGILTALAAIAGGTNYGFPPPSTDTVIRCIEGASRGLEHCCTIAWFGTVEGEFLSTIREEAESWLERFEKSADFAAEYPRFHKMFHDAVLKMQKGASA